MVWDVILYETERGECPVKDFIESIECKKLQAKILRDLDILKEFGNELREPHVKHVENGLFELRSKSASNIARIFFFYQKGEIIIALSGYVKKSNKIPSNIKELALKYKEDYERRH